MSGEQRPFLEDRWDELAEMRRTATTPAEKVQAQIEFLHCWWMTVHDTTEQLIGDPDWWKRPAVGAGRGDQ